MTPANEKGSLESTETPSTMDSSTDQHSSPSPNLPRRLKYGRDRVDCHHDDDDDDDDDDDGDDNSNNDEEKVLLSGDDDDDDDDEEAVLAAAATAEGAYSSNHSSVSTLSALRKRKSRVSFMSTTKMLNEMEDLGDRIENSKHVFRFPTRSHLWRVVLALATSLAVFFGGAYLFVNFYLVPQYPNRNFQQRYFQLESPYQFVVQHTIPYLQAWYTEFGNNGQLLPPRSTKSTQLVGSIATTPSGFIVQHQPQSPDSPSSSSCMQQWFDEFHLVLHQTSPEIIELVLQSMGLSRHPKIRSILYDYLTEPQPLLPTLDRSHQCLSRSAHLQELACVLASHEATSTTFSTAEQKAYLLQIAHSAIVVDTLTMALPNNPSILAEVVDVMTHSTLHQYENYLDTTLSNKDDKQAIFSKFEGIAFNLKILSDAIHTNTLDKIPGGGQLSFQLSILSAAKDEIINDLSNNGRLGVALASRLMPYPVPSSNNEAFYWGVSPDWIDSFLGWQLAHASAFMPWATVSQLMIPSISCSLESPHGKGFMVSQVISTALFAMQFVNPASVAGGGGGNAAGDDYNHYSPLSSSTDPNLQEQMRNAISYQASDGPAMSDRSAVSQALGLFNLYNSTLVNPSPDMVEKTLHDLCGGQCHKDYFKMSATYPTSNLDDFGFNVYIGFILWVTVLLAGLGLELLMWLSVLHKKGWTKREHIRWKFAQFLFPLFLSTSLLLSLHQNGMALPALVFGLWKFGYPETVLYMHTALYPSNNIPKLQRIAEFLNAVGTVVHHGAAALVVCMFLVGVFPPTRLLINSLPILVMQHWFVLLKYFNPQLYMFLEIFLEVWFEWAILSDLEALLLTEHWLAPVAAIVMLVAHWIYLIAGLLDMCKSHSLDVIKVDLAERLENESRMIIAAHHEGDDGHLPHDHEQDENPNIEDTDWAF